jgi:hypothetical protein
MSTKFEPRNEKVADVGSALLAEPRHAVLVRALSFAYYSHIPMRRITPGPKKNGGLERVFLFAPPGAGLPRSANRIERKLRLGPKG